MPPIEILLSRLDGVKQMGADRWIAKCPAHDDRRPSLSLRELPDGRVLLNCFPGCEANEILRAVGLELKDLYPQAVTGHARPVRPNHWHAAKEALRIQAFDSLFVAVVAESLASGKPLLAEDQDRLLKVADRMRRIWESVR